MAITEHMPKLSNTLKKELSDRLKASKIALERAELLYDLKDYSGAIFSIQQSSELMSKYFIAITYKTGYSEDKNYSHKMKKLFYEFFTKPLEKKQSDDFEHKLTKYNTLTEQELRKIDYDSIMNIIMEIEEKIENEKKRNPVGIEDEILIKCIFYYPEKITTVLENLDVEIYYFLLESVRLFPIALFSSAHQFTTRYTDGDIKPWEYDENIGIVKAIKPLLKSLNSIYSNIEKMNEKLK